MILNERQWQALSYALELKGYYYYDDEQPEDMEWVKELWLYETIRTQVAGNKIKSGGKPSALRFTT